MYINKYKNFGKTSLDFKKNELFNELAPPNGVVIDKYIKWISPSEIKIVQKISLSGKYK
ncbi:hypothetical protein fh0823_14570 [Francisella halioticida]|uniref:hypothetical protein n=1 Tax=Francisella halioticida TaxID=549298 RepID=UPI0012F74456|nr:hypothetical protein [Francisella halioticida]BCD91318.1 hypothetical protein fh0823_14570 [Francisella halioticida]